VDGMDNGSVGRINANVNNNFPALRRRKKG
jgi:hypothetical protein